MLKHAVFSTYAKRLLLHAREQTKWPQVLIDGYGRPGRYEAAGTGEQVNGSPVVALKPRQQEARFQPAA